MQDRSDPPASLESLFNHHGRVSPVHPLLVDVLTIQDWQRDHLARRDVNRLRDIGPPIGKYTMPHTICDALSRTSHDAYEPGRWKGQGRSRFLLYRR